MMIWFSITKEGIKKTLQRKLLVKPCFGSLFRCDKALKHCFVARSLNSDKLVSLQT